jgi:hypothetical protein
MAISYPLSLPSVKGPSSIVIRARNAVGMLESPFSFSQQVQDFGGDRWEMDVMLVPMKRANAEEWVAKLLALKGAYGTFLLGDSVNTSPRGSAALENYCDFPGETGDYASTPDIAANSITGDLDIRIKVALDDWTPAALSTVLSKWNTTGNQRAFQLSITTGGNLRFDWSADGSAALGPATSTAAVSATDGAVKWIRVTHDVDNGAAGNDTKFYTSDDGVTWVQLGTTVTTASTTSHFDSTAALTVSGINDGTSQPLAANLYRALVYDVIDGANTKADFDPSRASAGATSFAAVTGETWTINQSGSPAATITAGAGVLVRGASQTGETLAVDGLRPNQTGILKAGDWLQLGSGSSTRLHKILQDADTNVDGKATLDIFPKLRSSPADNAAVTLSSPKGLWRLASNTREWSIATAQIYGIRFSAVEAQ